jgi:PhnB protein
MPIAENEANKIMYIGLPLGKNNVLIANDVPGFMGRVSEAENRSKIYVSADSREEAEQIFNGLSAGGDVEGPIGDTPWGTYAGMFRDKYGIEWIVEFDGSYNG